MWKRICLLSCLSMVFFFSGCAKTENKAFWPYPYLDEEYLGVDELSQLPYDQESYADIEQYLTDFTAMLINQSFFYYGEIPEELSLYISKDDFKALCISYSKKEGCFSMHQISDITVKHNFEKAIVDVDCSSRMREYDVYNVYGNIHGGAFKIKVYFAYKNNKWVVENVVNPP